MFNFGDWVVYEVPGKREIGRVASVSSNGNVFVCYHQGCTAACTSPDMLRPYNFEKDRDLSLDGRIGYHRFDNDCPDYNPEWCQGCNVHQIKEGTKQA